MFIILSLDIDISSLCLNISIGALEDPMEVNFFQLFNKFINIQY